MMDLKIKNSIFIYAYLLVASVYIVNLHKDYLFPREIKGVLAIATLIAGPILCLAGTVYLLNHLKENKRRTLEYSAIIGFISGFFSGHAWYYGMSHNLFFIKDYLKNLINFEIFYIPGFILLGLFFHLSFKYLKNND
jgi:hypothetical protein